MGKVGKVSNMSDSEFREFSRRFPQFLAQAQRCSFEGITLEQLLIFKKTIDEKIAKEIQEKSDLKLEEGGFYEDNLGNTWYCHREHNSHGQYFDCYYLDKNDRRHPFSEHLNLHFDIDGTQTHNDYYGTKNTDILLIKPAACPSFLVDKDIEYFIQICRDYGV